MDNANWAKIYTTDVHYKADMAKDVLAAADIQAVVVDKKDSAYGVFGEIELYVQRQNVVRALHILSKKEII
ncbi:MAG: DUF2007 domain-containing protein [Chitinophagales bacterium]